jgi:hypothetical protein
MSKGANLKYKEEPQIFGELMATPPLAAVSPVISRVISLYRLPAATITHTFPPKLKPGQEIAGTITVTNTTTSAVKWKVEVSILGKTVTGPTKDIAANGGTASWTFPADFTTETFKMPNQDIAITIRVLDEAGAEQGKIDVPIAVIWYYKQMMGLPLWMWIIILVAIGIGGVYYFTRRRKK